MTDNADAVGPASLALEAGRLRTPAGLHANAALMSRRVVVAVLNLCTYGLLLWAMVVVLIADGWSALDTVILLSLMTATPWAVHAFWNSLIGLWLLQFRKDGMRSVAPFAAAADAHAPLTSSIAILMTVRNEDPERAMLRLRTVKASLDWTGEGNAFSYYVLSDTSDALIAAREEAAVRRWRAEETATDRIVYRRREANTGFKAGNIHDFCRRWGREHELMVLLDADSLMSGEAIVRLARMMERHPRIGILQALTAGLPSTAAFARIFQFGMRHAMRVFTVGQAWWAGDCGPFWGHNAIVRIKPFREACRLPVLPGRPPLGGHVLSHDHVEASFMRRAGYEVRVLPLEGGSWEENPPTIVDFMKRELRWCQGNMQFMRFMGLPGLRLTSRFQLAWAVLMFLGLPAWTLMVALLPIATWQSGAMADYPAELAAGLYIASLAMCLTPKIAGLIDIALTRGGVASYGGRVRFVLGACLELVFSFVQSAVSALRTSMFLVGLLFGQSVNWSRQAREARGLGWRRAVSALWPHLVFGLVVCGALYAISPEVMLWSLPVTGSFILAIPFGVLTAEPAVGRFLERTGICGVPEDFAPPPEVEAVLRPSASSASEAPVPMRKRA